MEMGGANCTARWSRAVGIPAVVGVPARQPASSPDRKITVDGSAVRKVSIG
jgi:hypothetical protein